MISTITETLARAVGDTATFFIGAAKQIENRQKQIVQRLDQIENRLDAPKAKESDPTAGKKWFTPAEAAKILERRPFTVREWCRHGRIKARKRNVGRGAEASWEISLEEIERYRNHGLLPMAKYC